MALSSLPAELWSSIEAALYDEELRRLGMTCRALFSLVQRTTYRAVEMTETAKSGGSIRAIASGPRAELVRRITYRPHDPKPVFEWEFVSPGASDHHDASIKLSPESREVLSSLRRFPKLDTFRLQCDRWDLDGWPLSPQTFWSSLFSQYHLAEDAEPWRSFLNQAFLAMQESVGAFSKLEVVGLPPVPEQPPYSAFHTAGWRRLLQGLSHLEVKLATVSDNGAGCMTVSHGEFLKSFSSNFLVHLPLVETVRIVGTRHAFIGHYDSGNPVRWSAVQMPLLQSFELEHSYLDRGLVDFLVNHAATLKRIYLRRCLAGRKARWRELFRRMAERDPRQLVQFTVVVWPVRKRTIYASYEEWDAAQEEMWEATSYDGYSEEEEEVEDERNRKFVVGRTCESYGSMQTKGFYGNGDSNSEPDNSSEGSDGSDDSDDSDFSEFKPTREDEDDESDVLVEWDKLDKLVKRNRDVAGLSR